MGISRDNERRKEESTDTTELKSMKSVEEP